MLAKPIAPEDAAALLQAEGYVVEIREQFIMLHEIPYVASDKQVKRATLVCPYIESNGRVQPPTDHVISFTGEYPCFADGSAIRQIENEHSRIELFSGCVIQHRFSNKPEGVTAFTEHYSKLVHYAGLLSDQARAIDPDVTARLGYIRPRSESAPSPFRYADTASARSEIVATTARLAMSRIAIIGLGGTGSYILDQLAKTPVQEIHLFDGDVFSQHNAFRAPGAATEAEINASMLKTDYFLGKFSAMHLGIVSHPHFVDETSMVALQGFDFVFVCVDTGSARAVISGWLQSNGIAFIDVGMSIELVPETNVLVGTARSTLSTPEQRDHFGKYVPMMIDNEDALYRRNIQVADMNAMNAILAVIKWKQFCGFYADDFSAHHSTYSVSSQSLTRAVLGIESVAT